MRGFNKGEEIGNMDARIELQSVAQSINTFGERVETWTTFATVWAQAEYELKPSKEGEEAGKESVKQEVIFRIRTRADVSEQSRILYDSRYHDIVSMEKTPDRQFMLLKCKTVKL